MDVYTVSLTSRRPTNDYQGNLGRHHSGSSTTCHPYPPLPPTQPWPLPPGVKNTHTAKALLGDHANPSQTPTHPPSFKEFYRAATDDTSPQPSKSRRAMPSKQITQTASVPLLATPQSAHAPTQMLTHPETPTHLPATPSLMF